MINLEDLEIEYRLSPRRKSIGLMVTNEGKLVVAAPRGTPKTHPALGGEFRRPGVAHREDASDAGIRQIQRVAAEHPPIVSANIDDRVE